MSQSRPCMDVARCVAALLLASAAASCSLAPVYTRPVTATVPASFKEAPGWKVAVPSEAVMRGEWWTLFNDPLLDALEQQVPAANQTLAAAQAAYTQARAVVQEQRATLMPTVALSAGGTAVGSLGSGTPTVGKAAGSTSSAASRNYTVTLGATWEPDFWGRVGNAVTQAGALAEASGADLVNATLSAQGELSLDYIQLRGLEAQKAILDSTVAAYERALTINTNRYAVGVAARADVLQAETALRNARASGSDLDRQRALFEHSIAVLVGRNPSTFSVAVAPFTGSAPDVPAVIPSDLLQRRPDIAAAERRVAAANASIGIARAAYFPAIGLNGDTGFSARSLSTLFDSASSVWSLGMTGALTLLDFGAHSAQVDQARSAYDQAVAEYRGTVLVAFQQTEDQLAAVRILEAVATDRSGAAAAASEAEQIARNQYLAGQIGYADLIVVQATALAARLAEAQALVNRQTAAISLIQAIGGGWQ